MIIVEGPDGSGKTTLIEQLGYTNRIHLRSLRGSTGGTTPSGWAAPGELTVTAYLRKLLGAATLERNRGRRHVALDRFHLSEHVYGPLLRDSQQVTEGDLLAIRDVLHNLRVPVILCLPPLESTLAVACDPARDRPAYQTEQFLRLAYERWERMSQWATCVFDYTRGDKLLGFDAD